MNGKELINLLKKNGWEIKGIKGSHHKMIKENKIVIIPVHGSKEIGKGLLNSILKQTGLK